MNDKLAVQITGSTEQIKLFRRALELLKTAVNSLPLIGSIWLRASLGTDINHTALQSSVQRARCESRLEDCAAL